jgi:hypothetical protein
VGKGHRAEGQLTNIWPPSLPHTVGRAEAASAGNLSESGRRKNVTKKVDGGKIFSFSRY